jgi:intracellular septation protein A
VIAYRFGNLEDPNLIFLRPSLAWCALAVLFWVTAAISPAFVMRIVWGEQLAIRESGWLTVARSLALFFLALGLVNLAVWKVFSIDVWLTFKNIAAPILFTLFLATIAWWLCRNDHGAARATEAD